MAGQLHAALFWLVAASEGNALVTGLPGSGKTSLVKWSLRNVPPQYAVVVCTTRPASSGSATTWGGTP